MDPNKMTYFMGFEMDQQTKSIIIDLIVASVVILFIMLPSCCFKVDDRYRKKDS